MALKRKRKEEVKTQSLGMGFVFGGLVGWILVWMECSGERQAPIGNGRRGVGHTNQGLLGGRLVLFSLFFCSRSRLACRGARDLVSALVLFSLCVALVAGLHSALSKVPIPLSKVESPDLERWWPRWPGVGFRPVALCFLLRLS